jgi:DNA topoisomerase-1
MEQAIEIIKEKQLADAPVAHYKGGGVTKGKGRFGPFIKYNGLFINVPRAYDFDNLSQKDIEELIEKKLDKEANRYIHNWPEEKISVENARWGPQIKFGKLQLRLIRGEKGGKFTPEELAALTLDDVKQMILVQNPKAFDKVKKGAAKKSAPKSSTGIVKPLVKKAPAKKATVKKAASKRATPKKVAKNK